MINTRADAMSVIFPNNYDNMVPELSEMRLMGSLPVASRYRIIDFYLSSLVNSGIDSIAMLTRRNYHSLLDHIGSGREWDLVRKNGGLSIFPPYAVKNIGIYEGWIEGLESIRSFLESKKEELVILSDACIVMNFDYEKLIRFHIDSGADVTVAYTREPMPDEVISDGDPEKGLFYTLDLDGTRVTNIDINPRRKGIQNLSMNIYVVRRKWLVDIVEKTFLRGGVYLVRDILIPMIKELNIQGYEYTGYTSRITDIKQYYRQNMRLLEGDNLSQLFSGNPIYTKIRDDNPTRYTGDSSASNVMVADGCIIEGDIENCVLFRGVRVKKGARVRNSIIMQDTVIEEKADIDCVITDKRVTVSAGTRLRGSESFPIYISKGHKV